MLTSTLPLRKLSLSLICLCWLLIGSVAIAIHDLSPRNMDACNDADYKQFGVPGFRNQASVQSSLANIQSEWATSIII